MNWWQRCLLGRGHIDQIRARVLRRLFLKSIFHEDFRNSLVSSEGWTESKLPYLDGLNKKDTPLWWFFLKIWIWWLKRSVLIHWNLSFLGSAISKEKRTEVFLRSTFVNPLPYPKNWIKILFFLAPFPNQVMIIFIKYISNTVKPKQ